MAEVVQPVSKIIVPVEIWQAQNYWPIKGWSSPLSGYAHYTCQLIPGGGSDNFPDDLSPPPGWEWCDKWGLDMSSRYGQSDIEGWFYASTFDRLSEMFKTASGTGVASKTSLVRKRRWVRTMVCVADEFCEAIRFRIEDILSMRKNIEFTMKEKEQAVRAVKFYEENRSFVFSQSLHLATQGTLNTLSLLKDIGTKLKSMKQYLQERAMIEREHASRMEAVAHKYWTANQDSPVKKSQQRQPFQQSKNDSNSNAFPTTPVKPTPNHSMTFLTPMTDSDTLQPQDSYELFFGKVFSTAQSNSLWLQDFSNNLIIFVTTEIDQMLLEIQSVLKEARASFRKNSDICRLSEAAIRNFLSSVTIAYDSVCQASLREIGDLSDELNGLKGGVAFSPATFANVRVKGRPMTSSSSYFATHALGSTSSSTGSYASNNHPNNVTSKRSSMSYTFSTGSSSGNNSSFPARDDIWLAVQRYKLSVRDSQEALCVLISESMDLELQHQIFANRVHYLFSGIVRSYCLEETQMYSTLHGLWMDMMREMTESINELRAPFPVIQSPFAQLNMTLDDPSFFNPSLVSSPVKKGQNDEDEGEEEEEEEKEGVIREGKCIMDFNDEVDAGNRDETGNRLNASDANNNNEGLNRLILSGRTSPLPQPIASTFSSPSKDDLATMAIGMGVFSFTFLYREPLPRAPGVVRSGNVLYTTTSNLLKSRNLLSDGIWKTVYLLATTDGYVHMLTRKKSDIPDRSFFLKESIINESARDMNQEEQRLIFELSLSSHLAQSKAKTFFQEGLCFRCVNEDECAQWVDDLQRLTFRQGHVDETVEAEVKEAMLQSLPILKGETAKMDLELQKYEVMQLQYTQQLQQQLQHNSLLVSNPNQATNNNNNDNKADKEDSNEATTPTDQPDGELFAVGDNSELTGVAEIVSSNDDDSDALIDDVAEVEEDGDDNVEEAIASVRTYNLPTRKVSSTVFANAQQNNHNAPSGVKKNTRVAVVAPKTVAVASTAYRKDELSSWKSLSSVPNTPPSMKPITAFGVAPVNTNLKPKQLIPKLDKNVPLARKHSTLIAQYEQALQKEKEKVALRVTETKDKRLQDVEDMLPLDVLLSPQPATASSSYNLSSTTNSSSLTTTENDEGQKNEEGVSSSSSTSSSSSCGATVDAVDIATGATAHDLSTPPLNATESLDFTDDIVSHPPLATVSSDPVESNATSTAATKKTRRLVKTLSQKFDVNALAAASNNS